jgi:uncharacterized protein (TIGR03000 family)
MRQLLALACAVGVASASWALPPPGPVPRTGLPSQLPTVPIQPVVPVDPRFNDTYALPHPLAEVMPIPAWQSLGMGTAYYPWLWGYPDTNVFAPTLTRPPSTEVPPPPPPNFIDRAVVTLEVPRASAEVWVGKEKLEDTGSVRYFVSPVLQPDKQYSYDVRVHWYEDGKERTRTLHVNVKAGDQPVLMVLGALTK